MSIAQASHITLPAEYRDQAKAWDLATDLVALTDEMGRDWIWYNGKAFYVGVNHLPGAQWVCEYGYTNMCMGGAQATNRLEDKVARHADYPHPASL